MLAPVKAMCHTITSDNGKEFARHRDVSEALDTGFDFARPYHSWERGLNEATNGLVRQYFPKRTNFRKIDAATVRRVQDLVNPVGCWGPGRRFRTGPQGFTAPPARPVGAARPADTPARTAPLSGPGLPWFPVDPTGSSCGKARKFCSNCAPGAKDSLRKHTTCSMSRNIETEKLAAAIVALQNLNGVFK